MITINVIKSLKSIRKFSILLIILLPLLICGVSQPADASLVGWWKLDEASGTLADSSGSNNTGTAYGSPTYGVAGKSGNCLSFNGSSSYIDTNAQLLSNNSAFTYSVWIKFSTSQTSRTIVGRHNDATGGASLGIDDSVANEIKFHLNSYGSQRVNSTMALNDNAWHHIVGTWDTTNLKLYIDGTINASSTPGSTLTFPALNTQIGRWVGGSSQYFNGMIDDVRIYNNALTSGDVTALYQSYFNPYLSFTTSVQTIIPNTASSVMTVQLKNADGSVKTVDSNLTLNLTTTSATGQFSLSASPWSAVTQATIPAGSSSVNFYYKDSSTSACTITVSETPDAGYTDATQTEKGALAGWWKMDEASGNLVDSSGNSNTAVVTGSPTYRQAGKNGTCLSFNGSGSTYATVSNAVNFPISTPWSVSCWAKPVDASVQAFPVLFRNSSGRSMEVGCYTGYVCCRAQCDAYGMQSSSPSWPNTPWVHVCFTSDGIAAKWYINGSLFSSQNLGAFSGTNYTLYISDPSYPWNGLIDDVRVYNAALAPSDVLALYNSYISLSFSTAAQTIAPNIASSVITVQLTNADGTLKVAASDLILNLTTTSATGKFSLSSSSWSDVTQATIPAGSSSVNIYYKDSTLGNYTITAAETPSLGYGAAIQSMGIANVDSNVTGQWDGGGTTNNWSEAANWGNNTLPGSGTTVTFTTTVNNKQCFIDTAVNVAAINITSSYGGTISVNNGVDVVTGSFTQTGATFTAPAGNLTVSGNWSHTAGTLNLNNGTVVLTGNTSTVTGMGTTETFNNLTVSKNSGQSLTIASGSTVTVNGLFTHNTGKVDTGTINAKGNVQINSGSGGGTASLTLNGGANATISQSGTAVSGTITVSGIATALTNLTFNASGQQLAMSYSGTLDMGTNVLTIANMNTGGTIILRGSGTPFVWPNMNSSGGSSSAIIKYLGSGAVTVIGSSSPSTSLYANLVFDNPNGVFTLSGHINMPYGTITINSGTLDVSANNYTIIAKYGWTNNGTFVPRSGTVTIGGGASSTTITGTNTFYNLTVPAANFLYFTAGATNTIQNSLTMTGASLQQPMRVRSTVSGIRTMLTLPAGKTQMLQSLDVKDNDASGGQTLNASASTDSGNNINWTFNPNLDLTQGLVAWYKFDEASGNLADSSGLGRTATAYGGVTYGQAGKTGNNNCLTFNGSNSYVLTPNIPEINNANSFSISVWYKANAAGVILAELGQPTINTGWHDSWMEQTSMSNYDAIRTWSSGSTSGLYGVQVPLNTWTNLILEYDSVNNTLSPYTNGGNNSYRSGFTRLYPATSGYGEYFAIGATDSTSMNDGGWFNGQIDEVRIYNRLLNAGEKKVLAGLGGSGMLTLKDPVTGSTTLTNSKTITASFTNIELDATLYGIANSSTNASIAIPSKPSFDVSWSLYSWQSDGDVIVYGAISKPSGNYTLTGAIKLDATPPAAPTNLVLTATSDNTGIVASAIAPSTSDVSQLIWRYVTSDGNVSATFPLNSTSGTALASGSSTGVTPSSSQQIVASGLSQLKTYGVRVWAKDVAGNTSATYAQASLYLSPPTPRLVVTAPNNAASAPAGSNLTLTITAKDANNNIITNYAGPYTLTWTPTGASATTLVSASTAGWSNGVTTTVVNIGGASAGMGVFTAIDASTAVLTSGTLGFTFYPASFGVTADSNAKIASKPFSVTVTALDAQGATVTRYAGLANLTANYINPSTGTMSLSGTTSLTAASFSLGVANISSIKYPDAGTITITAKDITYVPGVVIQGTSSNLLFQPAGFTVTVSPPAGGRSEFYVNEQFNAVVTAKDFAGVVTPNYRGAISFASQSGLNVPSSYTFTAADTGAHTFQGISASQAGRYSLIASDASSSSTTGTSTPFQVINAKLMIPNISGGVGTLAGGCYILNTDTNQVVASDNATTVALSLSEEKSNGSAHLDKISLTINHGVGSFNAIDTEAETTTVTAVTNPVLSVQAGTFTFGSSTVSNFRIEYNFEVTNYRPSSSTDASYTASSIIPSYNYVPPSNSYNQASMYDAAVSTGFQQYSMYAANVSNLSTATAYPSQFSAQAMKTGAYNTSAGAYTPMNLYGFDASGKTQNKQAVVNSSGFPVDASTGAVGQQNTFNFYGPMFSQLQGQEAGFNQIQGQQGFSDFYGPMFGPPQGQQDQDMMNAFQSSLKDDEDKKKKSEQKEDDANTKDKNAAQ